MLVNILNLTKKLISYRTTAENYSEIEKCVAYVKKFLEKNGLKVKIIKKNNTFSLLSAKRIKKKYKLILCGHLDVVPAKKEAYKPYVIKNRLYGRGAADMKGSIAIMIYSLLTALKDNQDLDAAVMLTTDEEIGGIDGVNHMLNHYNLHCDCAFIPDTDQGYKLLSEAKGVLHIKILAKGKSTHASTPWLGENAIEKLINIYYELKSEFGRFKPKSWNPTINLGTIKGGNAVNSVPESAEMCIDIRFPAKFKLGNIEKNISHILKKYKNVECSTLLTANPTFVNKNSKYFKLTKNIVKEVTGKNPKIIRENGSSDARYFSAKGIPVVMINPKTSESHIEYEWIDIKDISNFYSIVRKFIDLAAN